MGDNPSKNEGPDLPVERVKWYDAQAFCRLLNNKYGDQLPEGYRFDLPTEAQWEYACRAGTATPLNNGGALEKEMESCPALDEVGWCEVKNGPHPVGKKRPNAWGLHDMHGNVTEWCQDWYGSYGASAVDPRGPRTGTYKVQRGGSSGSGARCSRSASRSAERPFFAEASYGFRLALVPVN